MPQKNTKKTKRKFAGCFTTIQTWKNRTANLLVAVLQHNSWKNQTFITIHVDAGLHAVEQLYCGTHAVLCKHSKSTANHTALEQFEVTHSKSTWIIMYIKSS
jgi:hypothetical protein